MTRVTLGRDTSGRPLVLDRTTLDKLAYAEAMSGLTFVIVQGSWRGGAGAQASAGTHDRGGVVDIRSRDFTAAQKADALLWLRRAGLIAWLRTPEQGFDEHIHALDYGNPDLDPSAARQVTAWANGRNGLANNGPDDGPRVDVPRTVPTIPQEKPMTVRAHIDEALADCSAVLAATSNRFLALRIKRAAYQLRKARALVTKSTAK